MRPARSHHLLVTLLLVTVAVLLLLGTSRAFAPVHAEQSPTETPGTQPATGTFQGERVVPTPTPAPTPTPVPAYLYTDTSGIIALSVALVAIIVFGVLWGRGGRRKSPQSKKK